MTPDPRVLKLYRAANILVALLSFFILVTALRLYGDAGNLVKMSAYDVTAHALPILSVLAASFMIGSLVLWWLLESENRSFVIVSLCSIIATGVVYLLLRFAP